MKKEQKQKISYIIGGDSKMVAMRLPAVTRKQINTLSKDTQKTKTLVVVEAVDAFANMKQ